MSKRNFIVVRDENVVEYTATSEKKENGSDVLKLKTSNGESWDEKYRGVKVGKIFDNGDGVVINNKNYDYSELKDLKILLDLYFNYICGDDPDYLIRELK